MFIEIDKFVFNSKSNIIVGEVYRPPNTSVAEFNEIQKGVMSYIEIDKLVYFE